MGERELDEIPNLLNMVKFINIHYLGAEIYLEPTASPDLQLSETIPEKPNQQHVNNLLANASKAFTENRGQLKNDEVRFYDQWGFVWFTDEGVWFDIKEYDEPMDLGYLNPMGILMEPEPMGYKRVIIKQEFVGANQVRPVGRERCCWNSNYFYGNDSSKWKTEVPNYREIYYENLYNGIDLRYYTNENGLKYDFIIYPGADPKNIRIKLHGSDDLMLDKSENLIVKTRFGNIVDSGLNIYQNINGFKDRIKGRFQIYNNSEYGFDLLDSYQPQYVLVIDPNIKLEYSSFIGGTGYETGLKLAVRDNGNLIVSGITLSVDFPTTPGVFDNIFNGSLNDNDGFILKLNHNGSSLLFSTFIGGDSNDAIGGIAIDNSGNIYANGYTNSNDFPTTASAFGTTHNGGFWDAFVLKLYQNGSKLIYSTYIGGKDGDQGFGITIDTSGNAYITGTTVSADFPTTPGPFNSTVNLLDVFVVKFNQNGSDIIYSSIIGGNSSETPYEITIDTFKNIYITGLTNSTDLPITPKAYCQKHNGGWDAFVFKLDVNGTALVYSTFLGGSDFEDGLSIALDLAGNAHIFGRTSSADFPTTNTAIDRTLNGSNDMFITKLNSTGSGLIFSTFLGGTNLESGGKIILDKLGNIYVTGVTDSIDFPLTQDAFDSSLEGSYDGFLVIISQNCSQIDYSSYLGGYKSERCEDIIIDNKNNIYLTGTTNSSNFPTTDSAYNTSLSGSWDVFVSKFSIPPSFNIASVTLLQDNISTNLIYSRLRSYTLRVKVIDFPYPSYLNNVKISLDPLGANIQLIWDRNSNKFQELFDPNDYISLEQTSIAYNDSIKEWIIDFNLTFDWTYPNEDLNDVQVYATHKNLSPRWYNTTSLFCVENDLIFNGTLTVKNKDNRTISNNELVQSGEKFNWSGLKVVYENTTDISPPENEFNITIWDETGYHWVTSPEAGQPFNLTTISPNKTINNFTYTINLTGIPPKCDKTNQTFTIRIDGDNVSFSEPTPDNTTWQTSAMIPIGINITDYGGGEVKGSSVQYNYSTDNGITWNGWSPVLGLKSAVSVHPEAIVILDEGVDNLVKWQAEDSVGNGPVESEEYRIKVDTKHVSFLNNYPAEDSESPFENVTVGITISDVTSGVNTSSIEYSVYTSNSKTWSPWQEVISVEDGNEIIVSVNITLPHGTENRIRWRAWDVAGNGPTVSKAYMVKVNTELQNAIIPRVRLWNPPDGVEISSTSINLEWRLENQGITDVLYDLYLDTNFLLDKPKMENITDTTIQIYELVNGETYYWIVIPKTESYVGRCISGIWSFTVNVSIPKPIVTLLSPNNGSIITTLSPVLSWSVDYLGSDLLSYDVYLDTRSEPINYTSNIPFTQFIPTFNLEEGKTYYWKVVPWAGGISGPTSEIWSFTIKGEVMIPRFQLNLTLLDPIIEMYPSSIKQVQARLTNLGDIKDEILLEARAPSNSGVGAIVNEPSVYDLEPGESAFFNVTVTTSEKIDNDEIDVIVIAISGGAQGLGISVEETKELTIKILRQDKEEPESSTIFTEFWNILLIIIILILIVIIAVIVNKKRKKTVKPESQPEVAETVKPGTIPEAVISVGQAPQLSEQPIQQLPEPTIVVESPQIAAETPKVPTLVSSTTTAPGQVPETPQISQTAEVPQLPPSEESDDKTKDQEPQQ
jgi:hypothetical protein